MNDQSPLKRVTRARAAAKTDTGVKIATAASKAKISRTGSTTKRKTRADEAHNNDELNDAQTEISQPELPKITRGRAKKAVHQEDEPSHEIIEPELPKSTRGRPKKVAVTSRDIEPEMEEQVSAAAPARFIRGRPKKAAVEVLVPEPTRATRARAKKVEVAKEDDTAIVVEGPPKKLTRVPAATVSKATVPKKTVKFEEPDKENIVPVHVDAKGKAKVTEVAPGLKAKPVRKPTAPATRATRGRAKVDENEQKSSPLSPKKATQVATAKDLTSEDELASNEKTPMKSLMKSPIKGPGSVFGTAKKLDFSNSITVNKAVGQDLGTSIIGSPARRPPQSPFKESLKTSPQRSNLGASLMRSAIKFAQPQSKPLDSASTSDFKASLLQSPARRPQSPTKVSEHGSPSRSRNFNPMISGATPKTNTFNISRFATPRTLTKSVIRPGQMLPPSAFKSISNGSPVGKNGPLESDELSAPSLAFSGRLSSIMSRDVDPSLSAPEALVEEIDGQSASEIEQPGDQMLVGEAVKPAEEAMDEQTTTPSPSPPRHSTGAFPLREADESPFMDSDSEDELASGSPKYSPGPVKLFASSPTTPKPFAALVKTPKITRTQHSISKDRSLRRSQIGFTPLAKQLSDWMASSPTKSAQSSSDDEVTITATATPCAVATPQIVELLPVKSSFFEDEMSIRDEIRAAPEPEFSDDDILDEQNFTPIDVIEEDLALAEEAHEMSMLEAADIEDVENNDDAMDLYLNPEQVASEPIETYITQEAVQLLVDVSDEETAFALVEIIGDSEELLMTSQESGDETEIEHKEELPNEVAPSEASQEYGDENAIPIDPVLLALAAPSSPSTPAQKMPKRVLAERICHTVSKVPLKAAAEASSLRASPMKRSASISRLPASRPSSNLSRSNTVISYSPTKSTHRTRPQSPAGEEDVVMEESLATPSKPDVSNWSTVGTPARTPRRDLNSALLKGAVVFVDVHTSEGADASSLFTELLVQMGARCVKSWNWNPNSEDGSKIGITHVVFKDGGKRTLEKAKQTGGVVICVGVGWVLDCERENTWLPESSYSIDTTIVPRGGHRRRKSMEPRALANLNGSLFPSTSTTPARKSMSPMKNPNPFAETPLTSKARRRDSVQWVLSPSSSSSPNEDRLDEESFILSPVPPTPAPEFISAYGEEGLYGDETPSAQTTYFLKKEQLLQQTAPVRKFGDFGQEESMGVGKGFLTDKKDESVMMRLMAARRKSLQWAPKVGSPLAKGAEWR